MERTAPYHQPLLAEMEPAWKVLWVSKVMLCNIWPIPISCLQKSKKPETDINEIPRDQSLNLSGLEIKNTNKSTIPKEDDKSYVEITNIDQSPDFM